MVHKNDNKVFLDRLRKVISSDNLVEDREGLKVYRKDGLAGYSGDPLVVAIPNSEAQTSKMSKTGRRILLGVGVFVVGFLLIQNPVTWSMLLTIAGAIYLLHRYALTKVAAWWQTKGMARSIARYERSLGWALRHQWVVLLTTVGVFLSSFVMFGLSLGVFQTTKVEFFPDNQPTQIIIYIEYPQGTDIAKTDEMTKSIEQVVIKTVNQPKYMDDGYNFMVESLVSQLNASSPYTSLAKVSKVLSCFKTSLA